MKNLKEKNYTERDSVNLIMITKSKWNCQMKKKDYVMMPMQNRVGCWAKSFTQI